MELLLFLKLANSLSQRSLIALQYSQGKDRPSKAKITVIFLPIREHELHRVFNLNMFIVRKEKNKSKCPVHLVSVINLSTYSTGKQFADNEIMVILIFKN